jgi:hypothetical protein
VKRQRVHNRSTTASAPPASSSQRMTDDTAHCGLALPDHRQYHGLVARLPAGAWRPLSLGVFFISGPDASTDVQLVEVP